jgi:riboflavin biosynthesis pyrimidine reductase
MANLVIGSNGMSTLAGSSRGLSSPADRARFHQLRQAAEAILIGGSTYRNEPYFKCPIPLYISTRGVEKQIGKAKFLSLSPVELISKANEDGYSKLLVEGGASFLSDLIKEALIDEFYLTRSSKSGDGNFFSETDLQKNYRVGSESNNGGDCFQIWGRINQQR